MKSPIPHNWSVPQIFRDRFGARAGRQRVMVADGHLLIILHGLPRLTEPPGELEARLFWRKPDGTWQSQSTIATTSAPLRAHVDELAAAIDTLEAHIACATRAKDWFAIMHAAAPLARIVRGQSATLQEAREHVKGDRDLISIRDAAQENERAVDLLASHARAGLDYAIAASTEESAQNSEHVLASQHRLNLIAATFLPITALGALLGMNLEHGLERWSSPYVFWAVAAAAFVLGLIVRASLPKGRARPA